jgi:hypothetical protein
MKKNANTINILQYEASEAMGPRQEGNESLLGIKIGS